MKLCCCKIGLKENNNNQIHVSAPESVSFKTVLIQKVAADIAHKQLHANWSARKLGNAGDIKNICQTASDVEFMLIRSLVVSVCLFSF